MSDEPDPQPGCVIALTFDEASNQLSARPRFAPEAAEPTEELLEMLIQEGGHGALYPIKQGRKSLLKAMQGINRKLPGLMAAQASDGATPDLRQYFPDDELCFVIAERRDAQIEVSVSKDELEATIMISAAWGGEPATLERIRAALETAGISAGIEDAALQTAQQGKPDRPYVVARGRHPVNGEPATFEPLVESIVIKEPAEQADGKVDHRDRVGFVTVHPGDPLMRRTPATPGKDGVTVLGAILPARPGEDTPFDYSADGGAIPDEKDPNLLVARTIGHPVISPTGVRIDPTLEVDRVNLRTGNIHFEGSLLVREEIADGFKVEVGGDVFVGDSVSKVQIIAGGNVQILHGCIGGDPDAVGRDAQGQQIYPTRIQCEGSFSARFVSLADIQAGETVMVEEYIRHCRVVADRILAGLPDGKGIVQGGHLKAREEIVGRVFGSEGGVPTLLEVGSDARSTPRTLRAARDQEQEISEKCNEVNRVGAILLAKAKASGATAEIRDKLRKVSAMKKNLEAELQKLRSYLQDLTAKLSISEASITAFDTIHPNVELRIDGTTGKIRIERNNCTYRLCEGKFMRRRAQSTEDGTEPEAEVDDIAEEPERASAP